MASPVALEVMVPPALSVMALPACRFSLPATLMGELTVMPSLACKVTVEPAPAALASRAGLTLAVPLLALMPATALAGLEGSSTSQTAPWLPLNVGLSTTKLPAESAWRSAMTPPTLSPSWLPTSELAADTAPLTPVVPLPQVTAPT